MILFWYSLLISVMKRLLTPYLECIERYMQTVLVYVTNIGITEWDTSLIVVVLLLFFFCGGGGVEGGIVVCW